MRTVLLAVLGLPWTGISAVLVLLGSAAGARRPFFDGIHRRWSRGMLWLCGVRVDVRHGERLPRDRPVVVVANHQSLIDIFVLLAVLPLSIRFVAKQELGGIPVFSAAMRRAGHVFIDRGSRSDSARAMREAIGRLEQRGFSMVVFPEGTRSADGTLLPFKKGAFRVAQETGATLVPVAMHGAVAIWPKNSLRVRGGRVVVCCGQPVAVSAGTDVPRDRLAGEMQARVAEGLAEARS